MVTEVLTEKADTVVLHTIVKVATVLIVRDLIVIVKIVLSVLMVIVRNVLHIIVKDGTLDFDTQRHLSVNNSLPNPV